MLKHLTTIIIILILFPLFSVLAYSNLSGMILLQVEENGEAWYVKPETNERIFLNRPNDAFEIMKKHGLGIKSEELDYYLNSSFPSRLEGRILIDVERNGEAYYIYPKDKKAYFLNRPSDAFNIMRSLSQGISNQDLEKINIFASDNNEEEIIDNNKEDLPDNLNSLEKFISETKSSQQLASYLNKYFYLQERGGYNTKSPEQFLADRSGNEFDFLVFARYILSKKLHIVGLIRYEYLNGDVCSKASVVFRDFDNIPRQLSFIDNNFKVTEYGNSFRALIRYKEELLNIKVNRWAYFPVNYYDLSEPISPFTWQN